LRPLLGIAFKIASAFAFTLMYVLIKRLSADYPVGETMFFRCLFGLAPLIAWLMALGTFPRELATHNVSGPVKRSVLGSLSQFCGFSALGFLTLSEAIAFGYAMPLFGVILAGLLLGETVRAYRWSAVGAGFIGVLIMLAPRLAEGTAASGAATPALSGAGLALGGAAMGALASVQNRRLTQTEPTGAIVFYFMLITALLSLLSLPLGWKVPSGEEWAMFVAIGVLGGVGQILLTSSYRYAEISVVAPFEYTSMIWTLILSWLVFNELPGPLVAIGAAIVAAAGVFVIWRERRLGIETRRAAASSSTPSPG
jgi:drug/metabolite transporter (DMT)-like permease